MPYQYTFQRYQCRSFKHTPYSHESDLQWTPHADCPRNIAHRLCLSSICLLPALSVPIIPYKSGFINKNPKNIICKFRITQLPCIKCQGLHRSKLKKRRREIVDLFLKDIRVMPFCEISKKEGPR